MAIFEVGLIFCCPCFIPNIFETRFQSTKNNFEFPHFMHWRHPKKPFDINNFAKGKSMCVCYFDHLTEAMYLHTVNCLHYRKSVFYRVVLDNCQYPRRKCYTCYRRSIRKLLKYNPQFIV